MPPSPAEPGPWRRALPLLVILGLALATRLAYAGAKSLVLDEFHSTYHAWNTPWEVFYGALSRDNHPPLSFLVIGAASDALGRSELALRSPALVFGLVEIALAARLARRLGASRGGAALAAALLAASAMHFDYGTQARMYAPHGLLVTLCTLAAVERLTAERPSRAAAVALALGGAAALHNHYYAFHYLGLLGLASLAAGRRAVRVLVPLAVAALLFLPWGLTGFRAQLGHALPPGGDDLGLGGLAEAYLHLFAHNVSMAGPTGRWVFVGAAGVALLLAAAGALRLVAAPSTRARGVVVGTIAFGVPLAAWLLARALPRAGFTWHYLLPSAAAAASLAGAAVRGRATAAAAAIPVAAGAVLLGLHLVNPATEDFRGAIQHVLDRHAVAAGRGEDVRVVAVEWQPTLFPQGRPYDHYAPRLAAPDGPPPREPMVEGGFMVRSFAPLTAADRVLVVTRSLPEGQPLRRRLRDHFPRRTVTNFGYGVDVIEYARDGAGAPDPRR